MTIKRTCALGLVGALVASSFGGIVPGSALAAVDEEEPNDSFETATAIPLGTTVFGVTDEESSDYYRFTLPVNGVVKVTIKNNQYDADGVFWGKIRWDLYDSNLEDLDKSDWVYTYSLKPSTEQVNLKRGIYYLDLNSYGSYDNPYQIKIAYSVGSTSLTELSSGKKSFTAKWVKKSGAASYQLRWTPVSTYKLYGWDKAKVKTVSKKKAAAKVKGLKSKRKYYVQVRVAKKIGGKTYRSSWSGKKSVTTR